MSDHRHRFLQLALTADALRFGQFTLKSGRLSPYFFNAGRFDSGASMVQLAACYADAVEATGLKFDVVFGPAYKGIPLVTTVAVALADQGRDLPYAYNRKEAKDHGEGGILVGAAPKGRVVIVDDVLTAGTALREAVALLRAAGAEPVAAVIALDRQEKGPSGASAVQEMERDSGIRVLPLVNVRTLLDFLSQDGADAGTIAAIQAYQAQYGVSS